MTGFANRALCQGNTTAWEYWTVKHGSYLEPESYTSKRAALDAIRHLKAIGTPGPYRLRYHMVTEYSGPEEPVEEHLTVGEALRSLGAAENA